MAPRAIRRKGAQGELRVSPSERIEILALLSADQDEEIRTRALGTLERCDLQELFQALSDPTIPSEVFALVVNRLLAEAKPHFEAALPDAASSQEPGQIAPQTEGATAPIQEGAATSSPRLLDTSGAQCEQEASSSDSQDAKQETLLQKISRMSPAEKIRLALLGNQGERLVLIRDASKAVARAVLQSPKLSDADIEAYASMRNVTEEVLRLISMNRRFMKNYSVVRALATNSRVPIDVGLPLVKRLNDRDLKMLAIDKNVADAIRTAAAKLFATRRGTPH